MAFTTEQLVDRDETLQGLGVDFEHVNHSFIHGNRAVRVLDDFNLRIEPSQFVSIVGPSGCGKTTPRCQ